MSNRIYGTRTDINEQEVRDFYNKRAALASSMKNPLSAETASRILNRLTQEAALTGNT